MGAAERNQMTIISSRCVQCTPWARAELTRITEAFLPVPVVLCWFRRGAWGNISGALCACCSPSHWAWVRSGPGSNTIGC